MDLTKCTTAIKQFDYFEGKTIPCFVIKVYDGDTITVAFDNAGTPNKVSVRMFGYDAPEIKSKDPEEVKWGKIVQRYLSHLIMGKMVTAKCVKSDPKYGQRVLANIYIGDTCINQEIIESGWVRLYSGGARGPWDFSKFEKPVMVDA